MSTLRMTFLIMFAILLTASCSGTTHPIRNNADAAGNTEELTIPQGAEDSEEHDGTEARFDYWFNDLSFPF